MTDYLNASTRNGGSKQIVLPRRGATGAEVEEAVYDDAFYVRQNGEWVELKTLTRFDIPELELDDLNGVLLTSPEVGARLRYNGVYWGDYTPAMHMQSGRVQASFSASTLATGSVVFPVAFVSTPRVVIQVASGAGGLSTAVTRVYNQSTTGFSFYINVTSSQTLTAEVDWIAMVNGAVNV